MKLLTINRNNKVYDIVIDKIKWLVGNNYISKDEIFSSLISLSLGNKDSEYNIENSISDVVLIDEKK